MSAEIYNTISILGFVCAAAFTGVAVVMFFVFDIPSVVAELSGKSASKQVAILREENKKAAGRRAVVGLEAPVASTVKVIDNMETEVLSSNISPNEETTVLTEETAHFSRNFEIIEDVMEINTEENIDEN